MNKLILILAVFSTSCSSRIYNQAPLKTYLETETLGVNYQEALVRTLEKKNIKDDTLHFDFTYWGGWKDSKFYSDSDTIFITDNGVEQEFIYWISEGDTTVLDIYKQFNPGTYDEDYKAGNKGKVNVVIPQVYELANVMVALTDNAQRNWVNKDTEYYKRVLVYFAPYRNHPAIKELNAKLSTGTYLNFRENSAAYVFDGQKIVKSSTYAGFRARDQFKKLLPLIQNFAIASSFLSFYQNEKPFYDRLESLEHERAQVKEAWDWLQGQFPDKVDSYRIIMSPLAGASHSIRLFENNGFKENIIFMSAPSLVSKDSVSQGIADALTLRRAFTEMDHNYVNPVSDNYVDAINEAMADLGKWNTKGSYKSPYETFNEYMTWAVFGLFVYDRFGESDYEKVMLQPINFMEKNRGFVKFSAFNKHLLELFRKYDGKKKVPELYPEMLEWVKKENCSS
ncbi:DUF4932 domain-containing protein [Pontibacter sp. BAB1700]|uniref:DUF4932 domain-containing protein n=1 Tax=Pontibacter sp. BAB1700 TaxID=1144253 RepID=UPI00026BCDCA|nr:DUF4932 domain-containing protein [Pontibacter sp. BAB1700]EJF10153.1 hypothetical protein O71_10984 [Pontibacter sp. BAB1700]